MNLPALSTLKESFWFEDAEKVRKPVFSFQFSVYKNNRRGIRLLYKSINHQN